MTLHQTSSSLPAAILLLVFSGHTWALATTEPSYACDSSNQSNQYYAFCGVDLPIRQRAKDLVSRLTLEEKVSQLVNSAPAIPRLGIPAYEWWSEALHGVTDLGPGVSLNGSIKRATCFPQVIHTAASFDVHLWFRIGQRIGKEARGIFNEGQATGMTFWAPSINIFRDPRWGRGQETPGEDPYVTGTYAMYFVRGLQGDSFQGRKVLGQLQASACCKHLIAYDLDGWHNFTRNASYNQYYVREIQGSLAWKRLGWHLKAPASSKHFSADYLKGDDNITRYTFDAQITAQDMADTFLPPFESCIHQGRASGIMCAYNRVNGVPNCAHYDLLTSTARENWGFDGYITSDCGAVSIMYGVQGYAKTPEDAVADVLKAGMDLDCGTDLVKYTKSAIEQEKLTEVEVDRALVNLFAVRMRLGLFEGNPTKMEYGKIGSSQVCTRESWSLALEAAQSGIVLLKNYNRVLPLPKEESLSLVVIGPNANNSTTLLGNYYGRPCTSTTPLQALQSYVKNTRYHKGCDDVACSSASIEEATEVANKADYVVLIMGLDQTQEGEKLDRTDLVLPGFQSEIITQVAQAAKRPVILVILSAGPVDITFAKENPLIGGIIWAGYPGEAGGVALAQVIFGDHNPGGKLPMTWYPQNFVEIPMTDMRMRADRASGYPGRTYKFYEGSTVYEFGYGLSYTSYSYKFISVSPRILHFDLVESDKVTRNSDYLSFIVVSDIESESCKKMKLKATVGVKNEGKIAGKHPVLLYARQDHITTGSPLKKLVGFKSVKLQAGEKTEIQFELSPCEHLSKANQDGVMVVEAGTYFLIMDDQEFPIVVKVINGLIKHPLKIQLFSLKNQ